MKMDSKIILVFYASFSISFAYHYNDFPYRNDWKDAPKYPDYCCPLEWTNMTQGKKLPKDWIHAGTFMNRDFTFARNNNPNLVHTTVKSENIRDAFHWYEKDNHCPTLTNPNHRHIDRYKNIKMFLEKMIQYSIQIQNIHHNVAIHSIEECLNR